MNFERQEEMDAQVYGSTRAMHEHLLHIVLDKVSKGEYPKGSIETLIESYNNASQSAQNLMGRLRRLENKHLTG